MPLIRVRRKLASWDVLNALSDLFLLRGVPGSPWGEGYVESFNARFRDELLNREIFTSLREAQILIEAWRRHYNMARPHSVLGYRPPAPETIVAPRRASGSAPLRRLPGLAAVPARH